MNAVVDIHNRRVLSTLTPGDMVKFPRGGYSHYGVLVGNQEVVHLSGEDEYDGLKDVSLKHLFTICGRRFKKAWVKKDKFMVVAGTSKAYIGNEDTKRSPLPAYKILKNAFSKMGEVGYNIITKNCEHFANWCRYEIEISEQVDRFFTVFALGATVVVVLVTASYFMGKKEKPNKQLR